MAPKPAVPVSSAAVPKGRNRAGRANNSNAKKGGGAPWGIGGLGEDGALFGDGIVPAWVDKSKAPGTTDQSSQLSIAFTFKNIATLKHFFFSPNLIWFLIALTAHLLAPYDIEGAGTTSGAMAWCWSRGLLNMSIAFAYYGFFYVALFHLNWGKRKYKPGSYPTASNMAHNLWYWFLGVVQWTFLEYVMCRAWAGGYAAGFATNEEILTNPKLLALNAFWVLVIPVWRDLHFYIAHRFVHIRAIYKFVHSLHHRNDDPEPFSGITMHPVEHLYYYSNAFTPSLFMSGLSPLIFLWNFYHLTLAPAAGHSGWEDNWQADQYHFIHHAKFECNYGSPSSAFIDQFFGTFREKLGESKAYKGEWKTAQDSVLDAAQAKAVKQPQKVWSKDGHLGLPANSAHGLFTLYWVYLFFLVYWGVVSNHDGGRLVTESVLGVSTPVFVAAQAAYGPILVALLLCKLYGDRCHWRWPFHKENIVGGFGLFLVLGWLACIHPTYAALYAGCLA